MDTIKKVFRSGHAKSYDEKAMKAQWLDPAIVFGLTYRFVKPEESLLDLGIGTGLSSELYFKAGLRIYGLDFSPEMLACCQAKQMAVELKEHDLSVLPYPYSSNSIDHAVCTGVMHLFEDVKPIFHEVTRILRNNGTFVFVVADADETDNRVQTVTTHNTSKTKEVRIFSYSKAHIQKLLTSYNFEEIYGLQFCTSTIANKLRHYRAYVVLKSLG